MIEWVERIRQKRRELKKAKEILQSLPYEVIYRGEVLHKVEYSHKYDFTFDSYVNYSTKDNIEAVSFCLIMNSSKTSIDCKRHWERTQENIERFLFESTIVTQDSPVKKKWWKIWTTY
jgi:hypothetical protein